MSRADKDAARRVLAGKVLTVPLRRIRALAIARRYIRFLAHLRRGRLH